MRHDVVDVRTLGKNVDRCRFSSLPESDPVSLFEPERLPWMALTSRHFTEPSTRQKKNSGTASLRGPVGPGFRADLTQLGAAKTPSATMKLVQPHPITPAAMPNLNHTPRIIPVLDVMGGAVVHAVGGERTNYWPVKSRLTDSTRPLDVARALLAASGATELYVADLDAIRWGVGAEGVGESLAELDCKLLIDQGGLGARPAAPNVREIYALECRLDAAKYIRHARTERAIFSIELRDGRLVDGWQDWGAAVPHRRDGGGSSGLRPRLPGVRRPRPGPGRAGRARERKPYSVRSATSFLTWSSSPAAA